LATVIALICPVVLSLSIVAVRPSADVTAGCPVTSVTASYPPMPNLM
jgi:hypothetical protein